MFIISLILLQLFIFAGLAFFLKNLLTRNVTSATSHLQDMIRDNTKKQEEIKKRLEESQRNSREILEKARKEAEELKEMTKKDIDAAREHIIEQAHRQSEELIVRANKTCEMLQAEMDKHINEQALLRAGELICKVLPADICRTMHDEWLQALIATGLSGLDRLRIDAQVNSAKISTAFALSAEQKEQLRLQFKRTLDRDLEIEETVSPELVAGMALSLGNVVFDGSFVNKVREVMRESISGENK